MFDGSRYWSKSNQTRSLISSFVNMMIFSDDPDHEVLYLDPEAVAVNTEGM